MILVYFVSGECVDDVVNNRRKHQFTLVIVVHFMNSARVCWTFRRTVFNVTGCLRDINTTNLKGVMKNQDIKGSFFQNLDNFYV